MSLRLRVALSFAALLLVLLSAVFASSLTSLRNALNQELQGEVVSLSERVVQGAGGASFPFSITPVLLVPQVLNTYASAGSFVRVLDAGGQVIAASEGAGSFRSPDRVEWQRGPFARIVVDGEPYVTLRRHVRIPGVQPYAILEVGREARTFDRLLGALRWRVGIVFALGVVGAFVAAWFLAQALLLPLERMTRAAEDVDPASLERRLGWRGRRDEVGRLAAAFDAMLDRLALAFERERRFVADASHEMKTPLAAITGNAQLLQRWGDEASQEVRRDSLQAIIRRAREMDRMLREMLALSRAESEAVALRPIDLNAVVRVATGNWEEHAREHHLRLKVEVPDQAVEVEGEPDLLSAALSNLIGNAVKFTPPGGLVTVALQRDGSHAVVEVTDTGSGIASEDLPHIFERFYRGRAERQVSGSGVGLAIVQSVAKAHHGSVRVESTLNKGSRFYLEIPLEAG
ncbi:MAG: HAMP domain-containing histidine kinase [bacterium]|nr:HAMP domain-containing histidine kinase [bacterium]